ncbi:MAG: restriction endonuclease subunit S [Faecalibacterium prausnitzii]
MQYTEYELGELLPFEQPTAYIVKSTDYSDAYATPVLTAGKSFILGKTNETDGIFDQLPVIIFDDFTTATQFVNFRFKVKSSAMKILHINTDLVIPKYIFYRLQIIQFDHSTHKRYWIQSYSKIKVLIPPLDEQSRIVASIEELFSELDKAVDTLKTTKEQLEVYRQTILVDAFRVATNSTHLKIGYVCAKIVDCPHSTPKWEKNGKLCLRTTNFKRGYLDLQSPNYVSEETFNDRNRRIIPQPGDVLYSREGSVLGIACTIPSNVYPCLGQRMMLLRSGEKLNNRYLMHYLNSPMVTNHVIATKGGTGSPHINVGDIKEFQIPIPSLEEQSNIVCQIEEQLSSCDNVEKTVDAILTQADAMRQSILKQAFEGTL